MRAFAFVAVTLVALLSGCGVLVDEGQARVCRSIVPAFHPEGTSFHFTAVQALGGDRTAVRVAYRIRRAVGADAGAPAEERWAACRFAPTNLSERPLPELRAVITDQFVLGGVRLALLKRYWLPGADDPEPMRNMEGAPEVPRPAALALQQLLSGLPMIMLLGFLSAAYALVYGLIGKLSLAFGEMAVVASFAAVLGFAVTAAIPLVGVSLAVACGLAVFAGLVHGRVFSRFVLVPLADRNPTAMLIATVGLSMALQEYLRLVQGPTQLWVPSLLNTPLAVARSGDFTVTITVIGLAVSLFAATMALMLVWLMRRSRFGRLWRAAADDPLAYALMGLDPKRMVTESALLACVLAAVAGYLMAMFYGGLGYANGFMLGLKALVGAVIGGLGSVPGALIGGLLIGAFEMLWSAAFPIAERDLAILILVAVFLIWRPDGLAGTAGHSPARDQRLDDRGSR